MFKEHWRWLLAGFLFGALGLFVLAGLALAFPFFEAAGEVLFAPGRWLASRFFTEGSKREVVLLSAANGLMYAVLFWIISKTFKND